MALRPPPAFVGFINVTSSNDTIYWQEFPSTTIFNASISTGKTIPQNIAVMMESAMNGAGAHTYNIAWDILTGKYTILASGDFKIICRASDTNKLWTGGEVDSYGDALNDGQVFTDHVGFWQDDAQTYYTQGATVTSPQACFGYWRPTFPPTKDDEASVESLASEAVSIDGSQTVYDYTGFAVDRDDYDKSPQYMETRSLAFDLITEESRDQFIGNFWLPYAKNGSAFRYYQDPIGFPATYRSYTLTGDSLKQSTFLERRANLPRWAGDILMRRNTL